MMEKVKEANLIKIKTSNKLLAVVTTVVLIFLVVYDLGLKAEFVKGDFRKRFYQMEQLSFANFSNIKNNSSDIVGVQIEKGDKYQVWIESSAKDKIAITQHGRTLNINFAPKENTRNWGYGNAITIICPQLDSLTTRTDVETKGNPFGDKNPHYSSVNNVIGFNQPKMVINASKVTGVFLNGNQIDDLQATVGDKKIGGAYLSINAKNHIKQANIQVPGKSELKLSNPVIEKFNYTISDSTKLTLTGNSLQLFKK